MESDPDITLSPRTTDEDRYRTILEAAHDAIFLMNAERFVLFNRRTLEMFRCSAEELRDHQPWDYSPAHQPDGRPSRESAMEKIEAALAGEPQVFHWLHRRADGSTFDAEVSLSPLTWDAEVNLLAVVRDVSDRKRMEAELRRSEERYRRIVEDQTDFIVRWIPGGRRTFVNRAYREFFGVTDEEAASTDFMELVHPDDRSRVRAKIDGLTPETPVATMVHRSLRPDADIAHTLWTDRAFFDEDDRVVEYQSVGRDITEIRRLEEQLRQAQKLEALGRLAGGIAHDFNNSLAIILGYAELIRDEDGDPERQEYVRRIIGAAERSANINYQLLTFARKGGARPAPLRVNRCARAVVEILDATLPKTVSVVADLDEAEPVIQGDASQIENALLNLGINAGHAMPDGGRLEITTRTVVLHEDDVAAIPELSPGPHVEIRVRDTGRGIPDEIMDHIFEPFFTTKPAGEGTGLGLAAVYGTVQAHHGHIRVETGPGQGAEFTVLLPADGDAVADETAASLVEGSGEALRVVVSTGYAAGGLDELGDVLVLQKPYTIAELSRRMREALDAS